MSDALERPEGAPLVVEWNGILEGRADDPRAVSAAVDVLSACSNAKFVCEITGSRFSMLPRDTTVAGAGFDEGAQSKFFAALEQLVAAAQLGSVESTLRSKMVYGTQVAETLFALRHGKLAPVTRLRPRLNGEGSVAEMGPLRTGLGRREILIVAPLLAVLAGFLAWRNGLLDRILAARAETLAIETGPFSDTLAMSVTRSFGNYEVEIRRGAAYPKDPKELGVLRERADSLVARAAVDAVGDGGLAWVQVCNRTGEVRSASRCELRALLADPAAKLVVNVHGALDAATVRLSLTNEVAGK